MNYEIEVIERRLNQIKKLMKKYNEKTLEYSVLENLEEIYLLLLRLYKRR